MNNNLIEKIEVDGTLIASIVRSDYQPRGLEFLTSPDVNQQVGIMHYPAGHAVERHVHKPVRRTIIGTAEAFVVLYGLVEVDVYGDDKQFIITVVLNDKDAIFFACGGHGFRFLKESKVLEIKQGPYAGEDDKERF